MNRDEWRAIDSPTDKTLFGVVHTTHGPYAVGEDGVVLAREETGWTTVIGSGPATDRNRLTCVAATPDRERCWFAGDSGALGLYDTRTGRKYDYTAPMEKTSTWEAIAVAGTPRDERLCVANGSGEVLPIGFDEHGCPRYGAVVEPGGGSTIAALAADATACYAADTSASVFETGDEEWSEIGIDCAQVDFFGLCLAGDSLLVGGDDGTIYRYDRACGNWTPLSVGEAAIHALAIDGDAAGTRAAAVGEGGAIVERTPDRGWHGVDSPTDADLWGVALGSTGVAVGEDGTIIER
ncbi:beta propeller repeat protein [Halococcus agarilyticus]|uniref:hypothetical protein n=1 Tax=Halococcus agarilyticus TaxID=1232219 RepID=UPI001E5EF578|nr:hypothetical protein [Halococcus agarilyticus]